MFSQERQADNTAVACLDLFAFVQLVDVRETDVLQHQLQGRVYQGSAVTLWHYDVLDLMPQLEQRFDDTVILMVVCYERVIYRRGQVGVGIARNMRVFLIADKWIT